MPDARRIVFSLMILALPALGQVDINTGGIIDKSQLISAEQFTEGYVKNIALQFISEHAGAFKILRLTVGTDAFELSRSLMGTTAPDADLYAVTEQVVRKYGLPNRPIARVIASKRGALLSISDRAGIRHSVIWGQADPTIERVGGLTFRLLHFVCRRPNRGDGKPAPPELDLHYQCEREFNVRAVRLLTEQVRAELRFSPLSVSVRRDAWFFADLCPDVYRFGPVGPFLTREQVASAEATTCTVSQQAVRCVGRNIPR